MVEGNTLLIFPFMDDGNDRRESYKSANSKMGTKESLNHPIVESPSKKLLVQDLGRGSTSS